MTFYVVHLCCFPVPYELCPLFMFCRYPEARAIQRKIVFHAGPTNSGKTHHALERFLTAKTGIYCGPLKLLASEVFHKSNSAVGWHFIFLYGFVVAVFCVLWGVFWFCLFVFYFFVCCTFLFLNGVGGNQFGLSGFLCFLMLAGSDVTLLLSYFLHLKVRHLSRLSGNCLLGLSPTRCSSACHYDAEVSRLPGNCLLGLSPTRCSSACHYDAEVSRLSGNCLLGLSPTRCSSACHYDAEVSRLSGNCLLGLSPTG